jgi:hypothetical protein
MTTPTLHDTNRRWITADPSAFLAEPLEDHVEEPTPRRSRKIRVPRLKRVRGRSTKQAQVEQTEQSSFEPTEDVRPERNERVPALLTEQVETPSKRNGAGLRKEIHLPRLKLKRHRSPRPEPEKSEKPAKAPKRVKAVKAPRFKREKTPRAERVKSPRKNRRLLALVAVAGVLVFGKMGLSAMNGSSTETTAPTQTTTTAAAWTFQPTSAEAACASDTSAFRKGLRRFIQGPAPSRLRDYALATSPVPGFKMASQGSLAVDAAHLTGAQAVYAADGAVSGFARTFAGPAKASFTNSVYEFSSAQGATQAAADAYTKLVCKANFQPMSLGQAGVVAAAPVGKKADTMVMWARGRHLIEVDYRMAGNRATALANASNAAHAAWTWSMRTATS